MVNKKMLKAKIVLAGETQRSLAEKIGMTGSAFSARMQGRARFTVDEANRIVTALGLDSSDAVAIFFC